MKLLRELSHVYSREILSHSNSKSYVRPVNLESIGEYQERFGIFGSILSSFSSNGRILPVNDFKSRAF